MLGGDVHGVLVQVLGTDLNVGHSKVWNSSLEKRMSESRGIIRGSSEHAEQRAYRNFRLFLSQLASSVVIPYCGRAMASVGLQLLNLNLDDIAKIHVKQTHEWDCGLACLEMVIRLYRRYLPHYPHPFSLLAIKNNLFNIISS